MTDTAETSVPSGPPAELAASGTFAPDALTIRTMPMLRAHGMTDEKRIRPAILKSAESVRDMVQDRATPVVHFRRVPIRSCAADRLMLDGGTELNSKVFADVMAESREVVVFVLTLGTGLDDLGDEMNAGDHLLEALFVETGGWHAIEEVTRLFAHYLTTALAPEGLRLTRRIGPGYILKSGDDQPAWPLEEQERLFALFPDGSLPVRLLETSAAMVPKMSRSGLYGLRPAKGPG